MLKKLLLLLIAVPLIEIYFLIQIGEVIGGVYTILAVVATAILGVYLVRIEGLATLFRVQQVLAKGELPALEVIEGVILVVCGILLLTPGFFTDAIGFILLFQPVRRPIAATLLSSFVINGQSQYTHKDNNIIEGEFIENIHDRDLKL